MPSVGHATGAPVSLGAAAVGQGHDDAAARRTMAEFAGFTASDDGEGGRASPLRVDSDSLQRQVHGAVGCSSSSPLALISRPSRRPARRPVTADVARAVLANCDPRALPF